MVCNGLGPCIEVSNYDVQWLKAKNVINMIYSLKLPYFFALLITSLGLGQFSQTTQSPHKGIH